jgi:hypothetical protein
VASDTNLLELGQEEAEGLLPWSSPDVRSWLTSCKILSSVAMILHICADQVLRVDDHLLREDHFGGIADRSNFHLTSGLAADA